MDVIYRASDNPMHREGLNIRSCAVEDRWAWDAATCAGSYFLDLQVS